MKERRIQSVQKFVHICYNLFKWISKNKFLKAYTVAEKQMEEDPMSTQNVVQHGELNTPYGSCVTALQNDS